MKKIKPGNYLRELSVVIIGIAITFYINGIITEHKETKELNQQLNTVYLELSDNLKRLKSLNQYYNDHEKLKELLIDLRVNPDKINADTTIKYTRLIGKRFPFIYKKGAYEMFYKSGIMNTLNSRDDLVNISECYLALETVKNEHDNYTNLKMQQILQLYNLDSDIILSDHINITSPYFKSIYNFYSSVSGMGYYALEAQKQIEKTLESKNVDK